jgi:hypothetical protein
VEAECLLWARRAKPNSAYASTFRPAFFLSQFLRAGLQRQTKLLRFVCVAPVAAQALTSMYAC